MRVVAALALFLSLPSISRAQCLPFPDKGCYLPGKGPLLIYLRGHLNGSGTVTGSAEILASARQAFDSYGLAKTAASKDLALLVTGSSHLSVLQSDVAKLEAKLGRRFDKVYVAAHSGAYVGLAPTLDSLQQVDRVVLLDCFYGTGSLPALASRVARWEGGGAACTGFLTPHNLKRYETYFKGTRCGIDKRPSDSEHNTRVPKCLSSYLDGPGCMAPLDLSPAERQLEDLPLDLELLNSL